MVDIHAIIILGRVLRLMATVNAPAWCIPSGAAPPLAKSMYKGVLNPDPALSSSDDLPIVNKARRCSGASSRCCGNSFEDLVLKNFLGRVDAGRCRTVYVDAGLAFVCASLPPGGMWAADPSMLIGTIQRKISEG